VFFQELEELLLPGGATQIRRNSFLDHRPLDCGPLRRRWSEQDPSLSLGRSQTIAPEHTLEGRAPNYVICLPGCKLEYPVTTGIESGWQGRAQNNGQRYGSGLREPRTQFDEIRREREALYDGSDVFPRVTAGLLRRDHYPHPEPTGERRDDPSPDANLCAQMLRDPVAQWREGVRGNEEANFGAQLCGVLLRIKFASGLPSGRAAIVSSIIW
jgi:hypothetical protein